ncbi:MAG: hypothetical protein AAF614_17215 [Chloroflexota bacterium]
MRLISKFFWRFVRGSIVPLAFLLIAFIIFSSISIREYYEWQDSPRWESVQSTYFILSRGQVYYEYEVNGQAYDNDRVRFLSAFFNPSTGLDTGWANENRRKTKVTVYYDPDNPARSVLVREVDTDMFLYGSIGATVACLVMLAPILFYVVFVRWFWRKATDGL